MIKTTKKDAKKTWVTFSFKPESDVSSVVIAGEWNDWKEEPLKANKSGVYSIRRLLDAKTSYEFGYKIDGEAWVSDPECPTVDTPFNSYNSVLSL